MRKSKPKVNKVYIVGAGPGRSDLITLRGFNILSQADTVISDYLLGNSFLKFVSPEAEVISTKQLGKKDKAPSSKTSAQAAINCLLVKKAKAGRKVVRLKNGDPSIFGRLSEELAALNRAGIEFEIVPGVTAASAASAYSGIPLTERRVTSSCIFVTGHEAKEMKKTLLNWKVIAQSGTIVIYMSVNNLKSIVAKLIANGKAKATPAAILENVSCLNQRLFTGTLANLVDKAKANKLKAPAIVIIGEVVSFEKKFNWFKRNKRILFTGLSEERPFLKGTYIHLPLIKIEPLKNYQELKSWIKRIESFSWLVFTSRYGVKYFFEQLRQLGFDSRKLAKIKLAVIGQSTARALLAQGLRADLMPSLESSKGLIKAFKKINLKGKKVFLTRSDLSDKGLVEALKKQGAVVVAGVTYRNVMPDDLPQLDLKSFDEIMFSSPSTVRNFKERYKRLPRGIKIRTIGRVTEKAVKECKLCS